MTKKECKKCGKKKDASAFPTDNSSKDKLWRFCRYCEYLRKHPDKPLSEKDWLAKKKAKGAKKATKAPKKSTKATKKTTTKTGTKTKKGSSKKVESVADLEKRIVNLSPESKGINVKNVTPAIKKWAEKEGYSWKDENTLYVGPKAT